MFITSFHKGTNTNTTYTLRALFLQILLNSYLFAKSEDEHGLIIHDHYRNYKTCHYCKQKYFKRSAHNEFVLNEYLHQYSTKRDRAQILNGF